MIKSIPLPAKQIELLSRAQAVVDKAQYDLNLVVQTIMLGLGEEGQVVSIDTERNLLNIEVLDEKPALEVEA